MKYLEGENFKGKSVLLRASLNVPLDGKEIVDTFRLEKALPTLELLHKQGARTILIGHRSGGSSESLRVARAWLSGHIPVTFVEDVFSARGQKIVKNMKDGDVVMLENIRMYKEEKTNDPIFARRLSELADVYINDSFPVSHREHASVVGVAKLLPSYAGLQFEDEYNHLKEALSPPSPSLLIIGGAKFESKVPLAVQFLDRVDHVFVGGAVAHVFLAASGYNIGASKIPHERYDVEEALEREELLMPTDVRVQKADGDSEVKSVEEIGEGESIVDTGTETIKMLEGLIKDAKFVLWGGPISFYEKGFIYGTKRIVQALAKSDAKTIIGGGDVDALIEELGAREQFDFVSTAGGALLDFLLDGTLPGIDVLEESAEKHG